MLPAQCWYCAVSVAQFTACNSRWPLEYAVRCNSPSAFLLHFQISPAAQFYFCVLEYFGILMVAKFFAVNRYLLALWLFWNVLVLYLQAVSKRILTLWLIRCLFSLLEYYKSCIPWQKVAIYRAPAARRLEVEPPWGQTSRLRYNCFYQLPPYEIQFPNLNSLWSHLC